MTTFTVGDIVGKRVGTWLGFDVGCLVGALEGSRVGFNSTTCIVRDILINDLTLGLSDG